MLIIKVYMDESFLRLVIILCTTTIIFIISCWGFVFSLQRKKNHIIGIYVIVERNKK